MSKPLANLEDHIVKLEAAAADIKAATREPTRRSKRSARPNVTSGPCRPRSSRC